MNELSMRQHATTHFDVLGFGQRMWTSPVRVMAATNGVAYLRHSRCILGRARSKAAAISCPDKLPDAKTNSRTAFRSRARLSRKL